MAEFLTTLGILHAIDNIIKEAKSVLIIVSPYLQVSEQFKIRLKDAAARNVDIRIFYGKSELKPKEFEALKAIPNVELAYIDRLHAKCFLNEDSALIGSMNLYEFSEKNIEMGILLNAKSDKETFIKVAHEVNSLLNNFSSRPIILERKALGYSLTIKPAVQVSKSLAVEKRDEGFCIRCKTVIEFNTDRPYCKSCYSKWAQYGNTSYPESYCHGCGTNLSASFDHPQCYSCWSKNSKTVLTM